MIFTKRTKIIFKIFEVAATLDIIGIIFKIDILSLICKPLIIPALLGVYYFMSSYKNKWYIAALFFSFLGDTFLLFKGSLYFMLGLSSFLLAHLCFIKVVLKRMGKATTNNLLLSFIIFFAFLFGLLFVLKGHLGRMQIPVIVYGLVITSFGALSFSNYQAHKSKAALVLLIGALVFIGSDIMLAINKFYAPNEPLNLMVMVTYIIAQYLIFKAIVLGEKRE